MSPVLQVGSLLSEPREALAGDCRPSKLMLIFPYVSFTFLGSHKSKCIHQIRGSIHSYSRWITHSKLGLDNLPGFQTFIHQTKQNYRDSTTDISLASKKNPLIIHDTLGNGNVR